MHISNERGFTLVEVMTTAVISLVALTALYLGIVYAEYQLARNYHHRAFLMHASGELDRQINHLTFAGVPDLSYRTRTVNIPLGDGHTLRGTLFIELPTHETYVATGYNQTYWIIRVSVTWRDPATSELQTIELREDYFE